MRPLRRALLAAALVLGFVIAVQVALEVVVDGEFLADRLEKALGAERSASVSVDSADPGFLASGLVAEGIVLESSRGISGSIGRVKIEGLDRWTLLTDGGLVAESIMIDRPSVRLPAQTGGDSAEPSSRPDSTTLEQKLGDLPPLRAGRLAIRDGRVDLPSDPQAAELTGIDITAVGVDVSLASARAQDRTLFCERITVGMPRAEWTSPRAAWTVGELRVSTDDSLATLDTLAVRPLGSSGEPDPPLALARKGKQILLGPMAVRGLAWRGAILTPHFQASRVDIDRLRLHVYSADDGRPPRPKTMPHRRFRRLAVAVAIDTVELRDGAIRYSEEPAGGGDPGTILFAGLHGTIASLVNDTTGAKPPDPLSVDLTTAVNEAFPLHVHIEQDLQRHAVHASVSGWARDLPARSLNSIITPLEGVMFEEGRLDTMAFDYTLRGTRAQGRMRGRYSGLSIEVVGQDRSSGLVEDVKGLVGNLLVLRSESRGQAADSLMTVPIRYDRRDTDSYIKYVWAGLRSGLKSLIGL